MLRRVRLMNGGVLHLLLGLTGCAVGSSRVANTDTGRLAGQVTIYRDVYGVPHVHGRTDAAAVFGFMYAQAEDNLPAIEWAVLRWTGHLAELEGERAWESDLLARALEIERHARAEYENEEPGFRAIADAWAAGLNLFVERNSRQPLSVLDRFEPWHMFAYGNWSMTGISEIVRRSELNDVVVVRDGSLHGSNMWMLGPSRTASGNAMLLINPHVPVDGVVNMGEGHLLSDEGLNVYGGYWFGAPLPQFGHTLRHGWTITVNSPSVASLWALTFDHPTDPRAYRYGDGYRVAEEWTDTIRVRTDSTLIASAVMFRKSHHGPIVAVRDGKPLAVRIARQAEGGQYQQQYAMARARSLEEFREAVGRLGFVFHNIGYADIDGNIWYVYNGAVPRRSERHDWNAPVDGSDPDADWQGYHSLDELPQVLNPPSGWIVNTNNSPFSVTAEGENPPAADYPGYMAGEPHIELPVRLVDFCGPPSNVSETEVPEIKERLFASRRILSRPGQFTFDDFMAAATSRRVYRAEVELPGLFEEWRSLEATDATRARALRQVLDTLAAWDRVSSVASTAMTLYAQWSVACLRGSDGGARLPPALHFGLPAGDVLPFRRIRALETIVSTLVREWGTPFVPWGEIHRVQRPQSGGFTDARSSVPFAGGPGYLGLVHMMIAMPEPQQKRWYGRVGSSYVSVIEFGPAVRARSIMPFGQSADPASPHHLDQAELYGRGEFKPVWTTLEEVRANAVRSYRPGGS